MRTIGPKLVIATHNAGKLREIRELLAPHGIECVGAADLDLPEPEETGNSFVDNAELKAREAADLSGLPSLADDSGLSVDALHGLPGIFSARWAEDEDGNRDFNRAMERVWREVEAAGEESGHDAHFVCALSVAWPDGTIESFEGKVHGTLTGRHAATRDLVTIRCSWPAAWTKPSPRSIPSRSTPSAIGPTHSGS